MCKPIKNKILFRPFRVEGKTEGGIIVPDAFRGLSDRGEIIAVGNGTVERPMKLKAGMKAYRVHEWGDEVIIEGVTHFIMDDKAVVATE